MLTTATSALFLFALAFPAPVPTAAPLNEQGAVQQQSGEVWGTNLQAAREQAQRQAKDILVNFTGSDWCQICVQLDNEIFGRPEFLEVVQDEFVLVSLDYPTRGGITYNSMSRAQHRSNRAEQAAFKVSRFPAVYLMTSDGVAYARTGFLSGGPEAYLRHLEGLRAGKTRDLVTAQTAAFFDSASTDEARLDGAYALIGRVVAAHIDDVFNTIHELDPQDSRGVLAPRFLDDYAREFFGTPPTEWETPRRELDALAERLPSVRDQPLFHYYSTIIALEQKQLERASTGIDELRRLGRIRDDLLAMLESWQVRLEAELAEGRQTGEGQSTAASAEG